MPSARPTSAPPTPTSTAVCDALDDCPNASDPAQADTDNDGVGDACDFCTNNLPSFADRSHVTIGRLDTPPGDDTLKVKGRASRFSSRRRSIPSRTGSAS
jgi:hypothetical protein